MNYGKLGSSTNPEQLSATVSGLILSAGAILILVLGYFGVPFTNSDVAELATQAGLTVGALWTLYGAIRKVVLLFVRD